MSAFPDAETRGMASPWPIEAYLEERSLELADTTIAGYRWVLRDAERRTSARSAASTTRCGPSAGTLSRRDILELARSWDWNARNLSCLRGFLKWAGHPLADQVPRGRQPAPRRPRIWYTLAELEAIVAACSTPRERLVAHLACELMMRRVEIVRLRPEDLLGEGVRVRGKGRYGGKPRTVPYHPYTRLVLAAFDSTRTNAPTAAARSTTSRSSRAASSGSITGSTDRGTPASSLLALKRSALDNVLKRVEEALRWEGVSLSLEFHALRRTGGRLYVQAGIAAGKKPLEVLNELRGIYGHEDLRMTLHYVGWELEEQAETMSHMPVLEGRYEGKGRYRRAPVPELETQGAGPPAGSG